MAIINIRIRTDNHPAFTNHESAETARILRDIADKLDGTIWTIPSMDRKELQDIDGHIVGNIQVSH